MKTISVAGFPAIIKINPSNNSDELVLSITNETEEVENWKIKNIFPG
jgi:hypothetical protein